MTTPEQSIARRRILEGEDLTPTWYNIELSPTAHPDSGAVSYRFPNNAQLQVPGHAAHVLRLPDYVARGLRRLKLAHLDYLGVNPSQVAFESLAYLCSLEAHEVDEPASWHFCYLLRVIAALHAEDGQYWLDPVAWYGCSLGTGKADLVALMHGASNLRSDTLATKMAELELGSRRHDTRVIEVAKMYSGAFELFGKIIERTCAYLSTTPVRSADLERAHTAVPGAVLGSTQPLSDAFTRRRTANVMQPRAGATRPGAAPSTSAKPEEPKSMSSFDWDSSDDEKPPTPARKGGMRNILRRGHQRSGSSRSGQ
ncbi:hypothetical protein JCM3775_003109 [Rhodotorula graminis]